MNTTTIISSMYKWVEKLAEKPYMEFTAEDKKQLKADYIRAEELVKGYVAGNPEIVTTFNSLKVILEEQEGFFWLYDHS